MIVIFKNIPAKTKKADLKDFVAPVIKGGFLKKSGDVLNISLLSQRNLRTRAISYHGLVEIEPDAVAERVIKKLNRKMLLGKYVSAAEYKIRDVKNDPRIRRNAMVKERRKGDRRAEYEILSDEDFNLVGKRAFHTKGW